MSLLNKFASVKVDPAKSLLKGEDEQICKSFETDYLNAFQFHNTHLEFFEINADANKYLNFTGYRDEIIKAAESLSKEFVDNIVFHFIHKYKFAIDIHDIRSKILPEYMERESWRHRYDDDDEDQKRDYFKELNKHKVEMNKVLSLIQEELGGLSLEEKSEVEMKEKFYKQFAKPWARNWRNEPIKPVVELNKNRVIFERGIGLESCYKPEFMRIGSNYQDDLQNLFQTLSFFETGNSQILGRFNLRTWQDYDKEFLLSDIEYDMEKLSSIRFYKNRKMVLKFKSNEIAEDFFKIFCKSGQLIGEE